MSKVVALFVSESGPYPAMLGRSACWTEKEDARKYAGELPAVLHPPCQLWVSFAALNYARWGGEHNRPGNDGGCFKSALATVRRVGGVLEHPAFSKAWSRFKLSRPAGVGWQRVSENEWVCEVWQSAYGHKARKRTWLLYYSPQGNAPYDALWERRPGTHQIGNHDQRGRGRNKPTVTRKEAIHSPKSFAEYLVSLAHRAGFGR